MKRSVVIVSLFQFLIVAAVAQTDTITSRIHQLEGVTITETQRRHTLTAPTPYHTMDRRDMQVMGVTDMADALHRLPGITLRDYGGAGGMKTVSVRGFGAQHTGVSYDGLLLSECQSGEIDVSRYSLDNVEQLSLIVGEPWLYPLFEATVLEALRFYMIRRHETFSQEFDAELTEPGARKLEPAASSLQPGTRNVTP